MEKWICLVGGALFVSATASASCRPAISGHVPPAQVAKALTDGADVVGLAIVKSAQDAGSSSSEVVDIFLPFKGPEGELTLANPFRAGTMEITNGGTSFGSSPGTIVLAALSRSGRGLEISECSVSIIAMLPKGELLRALLRSSRSGRRPAR